MKNIVLSIIALCMFCSAGCGKSGKYGDIREVLVGMTGCYETFLSGMEKAGSAKDVAAAINTFTDTISPIIAKAKNLEQKYSEFKLSDPKNPPKEIEKEVLAMGKAMDKIMSSEKIQENFTKYASDPDVQKAQKKLADALKSTE